MKVKKEWMVFLLIPLMLVMFNAPAAFGADVTANIDLNSAYVWRGITLNEGPVAQPSLNVASGGFNFNVWGNFDLDDNDGTLAKDEFSEVDLTFSYSHSLGPVDLTGGYIEYLFPTTDESGSPGTREFYLDVSKELFSGVSGGITGYYDVDEVNSYYLNPHVGYTQDFGKGFSMNLGASCGIVGRDFSEKVSGGTESGFHEYTLTAGTGYKIDPFSFNLHLGYTDTLDKNVLPGQEVNFFGGVGMAYSF